MREILREPGFWTMIVLATLTIAWIVSGYL
jgi:hypothetical protein